jgi:ABC-type polar amino acid transport system ATPase subunit
MSFARMVADRVVFMDKGEILEIAPPDAFFSQPRDPRAREFLNSIA